MYEGRTGADRLAYALHCIERNTAAVSDLARVLNYEPEQLKQDIQAAFNLSGDSITTTAAKGYIYAAAKGIGMKHAHALVLLDGFDAAMENVTESEAEDIYGSEAI